MSPSEPDSRFRVYGRAFAALVVAGAVVHLLVGVQPNSPLSQPVESVPADSIEAPPVGSPGTSAEALNDPASAPADDLESKTSGLAPAALAMPVLGVDPETLVDTFDQARSAGRLHDAIDIMAPRGTPVVAAADGRVVRLFESERGGLTIYQIAPDDRTVYYYAHLDGYAEGLEAGHEVRGGEVIGYVGDTGNAVPGNTHLHFAVWETDDPNNFWDGEPINPYPLLVPQPY